MHSWVASGPELRQDIYDEERDWNKVIHPMGQGNGRERT